MGREFKKLVPFNAIIILAKIHPQSNTELGAGTPKHLEESGWKSHRSTPTQSWRGIPG